MKIVSKAAGIACPTASDRGSWQQTVELDGVRSLIVRGHYRTTTVSDAGFVRSNGLAGMVGSHQFEASMDTAPTKGGMIKGMMPRLWIRTAPLNSKREVK